MASTNETIIQARVTLQDIEPPIWRRLLLPPALNLADLHHVLQAAFGWRDEHLHEFIIGGLSYGAPELAEDTATEDDPRTFEATDVHLRDFDDSWLHRVAFEQRIAKDIAHKYPACVDGARHCPPEDVGGPSGYTRFLEAWSHPTHEEHEAMRQWAGRAFHPEKFELQATDRAVKTACRRARGDYVSRPTGHRNRRRPVTIIVVAKPSSSGGHDASSSACGSRRGAPGTGWHG